MENGKLEKKIINSEKKIKNPSQGLVVISIEMHKFFDNDLRNGILFLRVRKYPLCIIRILNDFQLWIKEKNLSRAIETRSELFLFPTFFPLQVPVIKNCSLS